MRTQRLGLILAGALCAAMFVVAGCGESTSISVANQTSTIQDEDSQDVSARSFVRLGMMVIETAYVDLQTFDLSAMTPETLHAIEPTATFIVAEGLESAAMRPTRKASENQLEYYSEADNTYAVGTVSESGRAVGVIVRNAPAGEATQVTFYLDGKPVDWGSSSASDVPKVTQVEERLFRVALPGNWVESPTYDSHTWVYDSYDESGRFMVNASGLTFASDDERTEIFQLTVEANRNANREPTTETGQVTLSEVTYSESGGSLVATFTGSEDIIGRLFAIKIVFTSHSIVFIGYQSYGSEGFHQRATSILDSVEVL